MEGDDLGDVSVDPLNAELGIELVGLFQLQFEWYSFSRYLDVDFVQPYIYFFKLLWSLYSFFILFFYTIYLKGDCLAIFYALPGSK